MKKTQLVQPAGHETGRLRQSGMGCDHSRRGTDRVKVFVVEHDKDILDPFDSFARSFAFLAENFCR